MLFFFVIFLLLVQLVYPLIDISTIRLDDACYYGTSFCLNPDGSTDCNAALVARVRFIASHDFETNIDYVHVTVFGNYTKGPEHVTVSLGVNAKGKPFNFYCSSDDETNYALHKMTAYFRLALPYEFYCDWKLNITANGHEGVPIDYDTISIDLAAFETNVPLSLFYHGNEVVESVVAPNFSGTLFHQLSYHQCYQDGKMSFYDNEKSNLIMMLNRIYSQEVEALIYRLMPDDKATNRSIKFVNTEGVSLTLSCDQSFGTLSGFIQEGEIKESIDDKLNSKLLDGYRCTFRFSYWLKTDNIEFDFTASPLQFSFTSSSGSFINSQEMKFNTDPFAEVTPPEEYSIHFTVPDDKPATPKQPEQPEQPKQPDIDWNEFDNNGD